MYQEVSIKLVRWKERRTRESLVSCLHPIPSETAYFFSSLNSDVFPDMWVTRKLPNDSEKHGSYAVLSPQYPPK